MRARRRLRLRVAQPVQLARLVHVDLLVLGELVRLVGGFSLRLLQLLQTHTNKKQMIQFQYKNNSKLLTIVRYIRKIFINLSLFYALFHYTG